MKEKMDEREKKMKKIAWKNNAIIAIIKSLTVEDNLIKSIQNPGNIIIYDRM